MPTPERAIWRHPIIIISGTVLALTATFYFADKYSNDPVTKQTPATQPSENLKRDNVQLEKQSYQVGQRVIINDEDEERPGIFLRPSPAGAITPDTPTVFDGDDVAIVEGPFVIKRQTWDDQGKPIIIDKNWWRVRIYFQEALGRTKVGRQTGAEGWISEEWLGEVMK